MDSLSDPEEQIIQCWKYFIHNTKEMKFHYKRNVLTTLIKNTVKSLPKAQISFELFASLSICLTRANARAILRRIPS